MLLLLLPLSTGRPLTFPPFPPSAPPSPLRYSTVPGKQLTMKQPVVDEKYDEVVFTKPSAKLARALAAGPPNQPPPAGKHECDWVVPINDGQDVAAVAAAREYIQAATAQTMATLTQLDAQLETLRPQQRPPAPPPAPASGSAAAAA